MNIDDKYIFLIEESETVFDMAAVCYTILEDEIVNPAVFVSEYMDESPNSKLCNPNYNILRDFSDFVSDKLNNYSRFMFHAAKKDIVNKLRQLALEDYLDKDKNQFSVIFTLVSTIDSMVPFWNVWRIAEKTSLNIGKSRKVCFVYLAAEKVLHSELISEIGRKCKKNGDFGDEFQNLLFLRRNKLPKGGQAPEVYALPYKKQPGKHCLKVAVVLGVSGCHLKKEISAGSSVVIQYIKDKQISVAEALAQKMLEAIQQGVEFVVFPEYCVSLEILNYLKQQLAKRDVDVNRECPLIAVFPGSTSIASDENEYDNVQFLLDADGREIGTYYKHSPYRKEKRHGRGYQECERLAHPGYRTSLIYVEGIGYVLPAICRDAIDGEYTKYLVSKFHPTLLMIPAWSTSGRSFERPLKEFASNFFANSIVCNGCGILSSSAKIMGGAAVLDKHDTVACGLFRPIKKPSGKVKKCTKKCEKFCTYLMELDFNPAHIGSKKRILVKKL